MSRGSTTLYVATEKLGIYSDALKLAMEMLEEAELRTYIPDLQELRDIIEVVKPK